MIDLAQQLAANPPRRILLIKPSALGDVVHAMPIAHLLKSRFPNSKLAWLINPALSQIAERHPDVDEVIHFDRKMLATGDRFAAIDKPLEFGATLAERRFDLVVDLQGLLRSGLMTISTRAPIRVGFRTAREFAWLAYTHRVASRGVERHAIERYLDVAETLGCGRSPVRFDFGVRDDERSRVAAMTGDKPFALLLPGTNWQTKRWPAESFEELAKRLREERGLRSIIGGARDALELSPKIPSAESLAGQTSLMELVALIERASVVVTNDSGPMHIAAALGKPMVSIFGPTSPIRTGPYRREETVIRLDIVCSPCFSRSCSHTSCMRELKADDVLHRIEAL